MLLHWIHELCSINVDVEVGCLLLRETFTTEIYHVRFTSASDEKHTIIIYMSPAFNFNKIQDKIAIQGTPQMAVDKEAICLSRVYSYYPKCNFPLFYV